MKDKKEKRRKEKIERTWGKVKERKSARRRKG
jgi:hypothetical protein